LGQNGTGYTSIIYCKFDLIWVVLVLSKKQFSIENFPSASL
jgi:hypothetical protein